MKRIFSLASIFFSLSFLPGLCFGQSTPIVFDVGGPNDELNSFASVISLLASEDFSSSLVFNIAPGVYDESVDLGSLDLDSTISIVFQSQSGDPSDTQLSYSGLIDFTLRLESNQNITFKDISIHRPSGYHNIKIANSSSISFDNCNIRNTSDMGSGTSVYALEVSASSSLEFFGCDINCRNENNWSNSPAYGIVLSSSSDVDFSQCSISTWARYGKTYTMRISDSNNIGLAENAFYDDAATNNGYGGMRYMLELNSVDSITIQGNSFHYGNTPPITSRLLEFSAVSNALVHDNEFINPNELGLNLSMTNSDFVGNTISQSNGTALRLQGDQNTISGLVIPSCQGTGVELMASNSVVSSSRILAAANGVALVVDGDNNLVHTNFIQSEGDIEMSVFQNNGVGNEVYFNTFRMDGVHPNSSVWQEGSTTGTMARNNLLVNYGGGVTLKATGSTFDFDHNNYHSTGSILAAVNEVELPDLSALQGVNGGDSSSLNVDPYFETTDSTYPNHGALDGAAVTISDIEVDLEGAPRDPTSPDIGAVEFEGCDLDAGIVGFVGLSSPASSVESLVVRLYNHGTSTLNEVTINWQVNNNDTTSVEWTGELEPNQYEDVSVGDFELAGYALFDFEAWTSNPNGLTDCNTANNASIINDVSVPMCGEYSIGDEFGFPTFGQAFDAMVSSGVTCSLVFNIAPGVYDESVDLGSLDLDSTISIVFQSQSGDPSDTQLSYSGLIDFTLRLESNQNITFKDISIHRPSGYHNIKIANSSSISFDNCNIRNTSDMGSGTSVYALEVSASSSLEFFGCDINCRNENNWSNSPAYGIVLSSSSDVDFSQCSISTWARYGKTYTMRISDSNNIGLAENAFYDDAATNNGYGGMRYMLELNSVDSITIQGNSFHYGNTPPITSRLLEFSAVSNALVHDNEFINPNELGLNLSMTNSDFVGNTISQSNGTALRLQGDQNTISGLVIPSCQGTGVELMASNSVVSSSRILAAANGVALVVDGDNNLVHTNFIQSEGDIEMSVFQNNGVGNEVYFNTFRMDGVHPNSSVWQEGSTTGTMARNNLLVNYGGGVTLKATGSTFDFDHNNYHSTGSILAAVNEVELPDLSALQGVNGGDSSSLNVDPYFETTDSTYPNHGALDGAAVTISDIEVDLEGAPRDPTSPDIGAVEFEGCDLDAGIVGFVGLSSPASSVESLVVRLYNHGTSTLNEVTINWQVNNNDTTSVEWTGELEPNQYEDVSVGDFELAGYALFDFEAWTSNPNGLTDCNTANNASIINDVSVPMCGEYSIGDEFGFPTFGQAFDAMVSSGVTCSLVFNIAPGVYDESVDLGSLDLDSTISIVFQSQSGDPSDTQLSYSGLIDFTLRLESNQNITFKDISIHRPSGYHNIKIANSSSISFDNCNIRNTSDMGSGTSVYALEVSASSSLEFFGCDINCRNENNWSNSPAYGIVLSSSSDVDFSQCSISTWARYGKTYTMRISDSNNIGLAENAFYDDAATNNGYGGMRYMLELNSVDSITIQGNSFHYGNTPPITSRLLEFSAVSNALVHDNEFINPNELGLNLSMTNSDFVGNTISQSNGTALRLQGDQNTISGLVIPSCQGTGVELMASNSVVSSSRILAAANGVALVVDGDNNLVHTNFIQSEGDIEMSVFQNNGVGNEVYFNTFRMDGVHPNSSVWQEGATTGTMARNNLLVNYGGGVTLKATGSTFDFDHNNYHSTGSILAAVNEVELPDLSALQGVNGGDSSSLNVDPYFETTDSTYPNHGALDGAAVTISDIEVDLEGAPRDPTSPDIGAVEFEGCDLDTDVDEDLICDQVDPCVGYIDECGECNGPGAVYDCGCSDVPEGDCDCDGNQLDALGVCGGDCLTIPDGDCDCDGNQLDALGVCGGDCAADVDADGICDDVDDCVGAYDACDLCNGPGAIYECGCSDIPTGDCDCDGNQLDALGVCGGDCAADADADGICDNVDDCVGAYDECGICNGPGAIYECGCSDIPAGDCDCDGNQLDALGVCGGDCAADADADGICDDVDDCVGAYDECGICNGPGAIYECGCSDIPAGDCDCDGNQLDALGVCGGDCAADADADGICDDVDDCVGAYDECGICNGPGAIYECGCSDIPAGDCDCDGNQLDALGVCGGDCAADADADGICDDVDDCVGAYDACGVCNGPGVIYECGCSDIPAGDCDCDGNQLDALGVCGGDCAADADADGICDDVDDCVGAYDACGVCNGPGEIYECGCLDIPEGDCDCDGNQLDVLGVCGGMCELDENENGVCDDSEIPGCMNPEAWNFDPNATIDAGNCADCPIASTYCGAGTYWDEATQLCVAFPPECGLGTTWSEELQTCVVDLPGDIDFDLCVGMADLLGLLTLWGTCVD